MCTEELSMAPVLKTNKGIRRRLRCKIEAEGTTDIAEYWKLGKEMMGKGEGKRRTLDRKPIVRVMNNHVTGGPR